jgi:hypothetical protein
MPIPETIATRHMHCRILDPTGALVTAGTITYRNDWALYDPSGSVILSPGAYTADLVDGEATVVIPATDAAGVSPSGRTVTVTIATPTWTTTYDIEVPSGNGILELSDLPAAIHPPEVATYATAVALADHATATAGVHGISDTTALITEGDERLYNARPAAAHAESHAPGGDDQLRFGGINDAAWLRIGGRLTTTGAPTTGEWATGDAVIDAAGTWHLCTEGGDPGTWT